MHCGDYQFEPVDDLDSVDLNKNRRFKERIDLIVPKDFRVGPNKTKLYDWLLHTHKVRNLLLHGIMISRRGAEGGTFDTVITHLDFVATMWASRGFPEVAEARIPMHKGSLNPDTSIVVSGLGSLIEEIKGVEGLLRELVETASMK